MTDGPDIRPGVSLADQKELRRVNAELRTVMSQCRIQVNVVRFAAGLNLLGWIISRFPLAERVQLTQHVSSMLPRYVDAYSRGEDPNG